MIPAVNHIGHTITNLKQIIMSLDSCIDDILTSCQAITQSLSTNGKVLLCGNGGSAADAQHIAAEFVGRFLIENRRPLPAIALSTDTSIITAISNDFGYNNVFSRQVEALGDKGDVIIGYSTSGKSINIIRAFEKAYELGITTIGMSGLTPIPNADINIIVPSEHTPYIQTGHNVIGHIICDLLERYYMEV